MATQLVTYFVTSPKGQKHHEFTVSDSEIEILDSDRVLIEYFPNTCQDDFGHEVLRTIPARLKPNETQPAGALRK